MTHALAVNCHGNRQAQHNCRGGVAEDSNQANSIQPDFKKMTSIDEGKLVSVNSSKKRG